MKKLADLFPPSLYDGIENQNYQLNLGPIWHSDASIFKTLIKEVAPRIIVEIGSWYGASAIHMAAIVKEMQLDCHIYCVDTWLGSFEHWTMTQLRQCLMLKNGYPQFFYQFLFNVKASGVSDIITPVPNTSSMASALFKVRSIRPQLVYLDGSHEEKDVYNDLDNYVPLLDGKGVIFGDDWNTYPGVKSAVNRYFDKKEEYVLSAPVEEAFWISRKRMV
jgi:hypothetical protein